MAKLIFRTGQFAGKSIGLPAGRTLVLGRNRDIDLPLPDLKLSRRHCEIGNANGRCFVKDLNSTNGTFVNNERLGPQQPRDLRSNDRVMLGDTEIQFEGDAEEFLITGPGADISNMATPQPGALPSNLADVIPGAAHPPPFAPQPVPIAAAPISQVPAQMYGGGDPRVAQFQAALQEIFRPLPPEPPPLPGTTPGNRPKFIFCDGCNGSIPLLDVDLGTAKEVEGKMICKDCLARGIHISVVRPAASPPLVTGAVAGLPPPPAYRPPPQPQPANVDSMLAGLEQEAVVVDTTIKRRGVELQEQDVAESINQFERTTAAAGGRVGGGAGNDPKLRQAAATQTPPAATQPAPKPAPPAAPSNDELGDEFEEIG